MVKTSSFWLHAYDYPYRVLCRTLTQQESGTKHTAYWLQWNELLLCHISWSDMYRRANMVIQYIRRQICVIACFVRQRLKFTTNCSRHSTHADTSEMNSVMWHDVNKEFIASVFVDMCWVAVCELCLFMSASYPVYWVYCPAAVCQHTSAHCTYAITSEVDNRQTTDIYALHCIIARQNIWTYFWWNVEGNIHETLKECLLFSLPCLSLCARATEHNFWPKNLIYVE